MKEGGPLFRAGATMSQPFIILRKERRGRIRNGKEPEKLIISGGRGADTKIFKKYTLGEKGGKAFGGGIMKQKEIIIRKKGTKVNSERQKK